MSQSSFSPPTPPNNNTPGALAPRPPQDLAPTASGGSSLAINYFDQPVILRQQPWVPQFIIVTIVGVTTFTIAWACIAKVDEAIPAQGKLEPTGSVQPVQAPVGGVVKQILVEEGDRVTQDQTLIIFDQTTALAEQNSLREVQQSLESENRYYRAQMDNTRGDLPAIPLTDIPPEAATLTANRATLVEENNLYRAMLGNGNVSLSLAQQQRLNSFLSERESRVAAAQSRVEQAQRQFNQVQVQLTSTQNQLKVNQEILDRILPLSKDGGIAEIQVLRQQQEVDNLASEYDRLIEEQQRIQYTITEAQETLANTQAVSTDDILTRIAENEKRLADIDSQLSKVIVENEKQIREINSQLSQAAQTLIYQELKAPTAGTVFDLEAVGPGFVANTSEPILKIVPDSTLVAEVFITNQDIGFVNSALRDAEVARAQAGGNIDKNECWAGSPTQTDTNSKTSVCVDVRIDSFPYSEFGDIKGKLISIGSDALPPDEIYQFYRFPAKIELERQAMSIENQEVALQSGMSVSVNIKTRKRPIITFLTDLFVRKIDTLRSKS